MYWNTLPLGRSICPQSDFLIRVRKAQLTLRPTKCSVGFFGVPYLGHCVGNQSLQTTPGMVNKISQAPKQADKKQLRSFLGLIEYYRKFIPNIAAISVSLTDLTRRPASADRTARRQFQATGQPVSRTQASDTMTSRLPRYEAKCVQRMYFQCGSVPLRSNIKGTELPLSIY